MKLFNFEDILSTLGFEFLELSILELYNFSFPFFFSSCTPSSKYVEVLCILQTDVSRLGNAVWTKSGTQGNKWNAGQINIPAQTTLFSIVFEGLVGPSYRGDIAIDDVNVVSGACASPGLLLFAFFRG